MIEIPFILQFTRSKEGLLNYEHNCNETRNCLHDYDIKNFQTLNIQFYGSNEACRGFTYGLCIKNGYEDKLWYFKNIDMHDYMPYMIDTDIMYYDPFCLIINDIGGWKFNTTQPEEFLKGFLVSLKYNIRDTSNYVTNFSCNNIIYFQNDTEYHCGICGTVNKVENNNYECTNCNNDLIYIDSARITKTKLYELRNNTYDFDIHYSEPKMTIRAPVKVINKHEQYLEKCYAICKNGKKCTNNAKYNGVCRKHLGGI